MVTSRALLPNETTAPGVFTSEELFFLPRALRPVGGKRFMVEKGIGGGSYIIEKSKLRKS